MFGVSSCCSDFKRHRFQVLLSWFQLQTTVTHTHTHIFENGGINIHKIVQASTMLNDEKYNMRMIFLWLTELYITICKLVEIGNELAFHDYQLIWRERERERERERAVSFFYDILDRGS